MIGMAIQPAPPQPRLVFVKFFGYRVPRGELKIPDRSWLTSGKKFHALYSYIFTLATKIPHYILV